VITAEKQSDRYATVRLSDQAVALAERHSIESVPKEIGGVLVGWWEGRDTVVVHDFLIVRDHSAGWNHYVRVHQVADDLLVAYIKDAGDPRLGYVGEWHSHPAPQPPSATDRAALASTARQSQNPVALVVLAVTSSHDVVAHALIGRARWPRRTAIRPATIERMDP
jgi:proteasome lid subunit RPN8/RPN11